MIRKILLVSFPITGSVTGPNAYSGVLTFANGNQVFSTGLDDLGNPLANGASDNHYEFVLNPANSLTNPFVVSASYLASNTSQSQWIGPVGAGVNAPDAPSNNVFSVETEIDLTGLDLTGFRIDGLWVSDNTGIDILVNGSSTGQANSGSHNLPLTSKPENAFSLSTGLIAGVNKVQFQWVNAPFGPSNPTHVRVEFSSFSTTATVPEPASLLNFLVLGGASCVFRRRRHLR